MRLTKNRLMTDGKFYQNDGYISNGYWLIKEKYRLKVLETVKPESQKPDMKRFERMLGDAYLQQVQPIECRKLQSLEVPAFSDPDALPVVKFSCKDFDIVVNGYFLRMFESVRIGLEFFTTGSFAPLMITSRGEFLGVIMPLRVDRF